MKKFHFQACTFAAVAAALVLSDSAFAQLAPVFEGLPLVEAIDCSKTPPGADMYREQPAGISKVMPILGQQARVLPNDKPGLKFFGYRIGKGKNLEANAAYVLEIEYPEDAPRSVFVVNQGAEITRGFHTGPTIGDALKPLYVNNKPESLSIPLSNKYEKSQMLFHLDEHFPDQLRPRGAEFPRNQRPSDGFWVFIAQFEPENDPLSKGAAVSHIRLYKAPAFETYALKLNLPPKELPQRHLFYREEMGDSVVGKDKDRGLTNSNDWYVHKARLLRFLGMDTFAKDLLEFGANQGWDSSKFGGDRWVYQSHEPQRWNRIVDTATKYGLNVLPYYEYAGSKGAQGYGEKLLAKPLGNVATYTHITWTEKARADLTDPDAFEDFRKMLEITVVDLKNRGNFVGVWLRPRPSELPISFGDEALARFNSETKPAKPVTREMIRGDRSLYNSYKAWWFTKRIAFLDKIRDYLREKSNPESVVLYTADPSEPGRDNPNKSKAGLVVEDPAAWAGVKTEMTPLKVAASDHRQLEALTLPPSTYGVEEWHHAAPEYDPPSFQKNEGVLPTFSFNRSWTVADPQAFDAFRTPSGIAMIRHFALNENMFTTRKDGKPIGQGLFGYFVSDVDLAGPYCMLAEARAMANGDPRFIGYLSGGMFNRGFPQYVRNFNAAFMSLPALPSSRLDKVSPDPEVVIRRIDAGKYGVYYAVVNTGYRSKANLTLKLPDTGKLQNAATGQDIVTKDGSLQVSMYPCQLISLRVTK